MRFKAVKSPLMTLFSFDTANDNIYHMLDGMQGVYSKMPGVVLHFILGLLS